MAKFIAENATLTFGTSDIVSMCKNSTSINITCETASMRCFGDGGWATNAATTKSWDVAFETALDDTLGIDLDGTIGESATLTFDTVDGLGYTGTVIITKCDITAPVDDYAKVSWSAVGSGALSEA